jgi:hypothetical protein
LAFIAAADHGVWYLPVGPVSDGVFQDIHTPIQFVARDASEFGERLLADAEAFVAGALDRKYLGE